MRRWLLVATLVAVVALLLTGTATADNGPHTGDFPEATDACAGCHRAHRGQTDELLTVASQQELCLSCHGTGTPGADTNVSDGVYDGTGGGGLRGGGFTNAVMDTGMTGTPVIGTVTSKHNVGLPGTIWGNGDTGSGTTGVTLQCSSCHNPHGFTGSDKYRVLRPQPKDSGASPGAPVPDETTKNYTITYYGIDHYRIVAYMGSEIGGWCAQCHTRYLAINSDDSGDAIFTNRHQTSGSTTHCLACHVAHGTSAAMGTDSGGVELPDGTVGGGSGDSRLLHVNNRGVCIQCHPAP